MGLIISLFRFKVPSLSIRVIQAARAFAEQVLIKLFYYTQVLAFFFISPDLIAAGNSTIAQTVQMNHSNACCGTTFQWLPPCCNTGV